jgi:hypothetical protein
VFTFDTAQKVDALGRFYQAELPKHGYVFRNTTPKGITTSVQFAFTQPQCGSMAISRPTGATSSSVIVALGSPCPIQPQPSSS